MIDNYVISKTIDQILDSNQELNEEHKKQCKNMVLDLKGKFRVYWKVGQKKRNVQINGELYGTVFSGHPTRTTFGNTLRVVVYNKFVLYKAGCPERNYKLHVNGDDTLLMFSKLYKQLIIDSFNKYYFNVS